MSPLRTSTGNIFQTFYLMNIFSEKREFCSFLALMYNLFCFQYSLGNVQKDVMVMEPVLRELVGKVNYHRISGLCLIARKNVFGVSNQARHKLACSATDTSWSLEIVCRESREFLLLWQRKTKVLISLHEAKSRFSHNIAQS